MEDNEVALKAFQDPPLLGLALFLFIVSLIGIRALYMGQFITRIVSGGCST
jgi:hypothetical protein